MEYLFDPEETGYVIVSGAIMDGALHVEKYDGSDRFASNEEAARQAEIDGIPIIHGLPADAMEERDVAAYLDTPENREVFAAAMERRYGDEIKVGNLNEIEDTGAALGTLMNKVASLQNLLAAYQAGMLDVAFSLGKTEEELGKIFQTNGKPDVGRLYDPERFDRMSPSEFVEACRDFREENELGLRELDALSGMVKSDISATQKNMEEMAESLRGFYAKKEELDAQVGKGVVLETFEKGEGQELPAALIFDSTAYKPYAAVDAYDAATGERHGERCFDNVSDAYDAANPEVIEGATVRLTCGDVRDYLKSENVATSETNVRRAVLPSGFPGASDWPPLATLVSDRMRDELHSTVEGRVNWMALEGHFEPAVATQEVGRLVGLEKTESRAKGAEVGRLDGQGQEVAQESLQQGRQPQEKKAMKSWGKPERAPASAPADPRTDQRMAQESAKAQGRHVPVRMQEQSRGRQ